MKKVCKQRPAKCNGIILLAQQQQTKKQATAQAKLFNFNFRHHPTIQTSNGIEHLDVRMDVRIDLHAVEANTNKEPEEEEMSMPAMVVGYTQKEIDVLVALLEAKTVAVESKLIKKPTNKQEERRQHKKRAIKKNNNIASIQSQQKQSEENKQQIQEVDSHHQPEQTISTHSKRRGRRVKYRRHNTRQKLGRTLSAREEEKLAMLAFEQDDTSITQTKETSAIAPSRPASIRARLYSHIDDVRSNPAARKRLVEVAKEHLHQVAERHNNLIQWNNQRELTRNSVVRNAKSHWVDQHMCKVQNTDVDIVRAQKWWVLVKTASVVVNIPTIIAQAKTEKKRRNEQTLRRRQRMRRRAQGLGDEANQAAAMMATMNVTHVASGLRETLLGETNPYEQHYTYMKKLEKVFCRYRKHLVADRIADGEVVDGEVHGEVAGSGNVAVDGEVAGEDEDASGNSGNSGNSGQVGDGTDDGSTVKLRTEEKSTQQQETKEGTNLNAHNVDKEPQDEFDVVSTLAQQQLEEIEVPSTIALPNQTDMLPLSPGLLKSFSRPTFKNNTVGTSPKHTLQNINNNNNNNNEKTTRNTDSRLSTFANKNTRKKEKKKNPVSPKWNSGGGNGVISWNPSNFRKNLTKKPSARSDDGSESSIDAPLDQRLFKMHRYDWCRRSKNQQPQLPQRKDGRDPWSGVENYKKDMQTNLSQLLANIDPILDQAVRIAGIFGIDLIYEMGRQNLFKSDAFVHTNAENIHDKTEKGHEIFIRRVITVDDPHDEGSKNNDLNPKVSNIPNNAFTTNNKNKTRIAQIDRRASTTLEYAGASSVLMEEEKIWAQRMQDMMAHTKYERQNYEHATKSFKEVCKIRKNALKQTSILILDAARKHHAKYFATPRKPDGEHLGRPEDVFQHRTTKIFLPSDSHSLPLKQPPYIYEPYVENKKELDFTASYRTRDVLKEVPPGFDANFLAHVKLRLKDLKVMDRLIDDTMKHIREHERSEERKRKARALY